jgi:mannose-6-phosphate isomerase-like protein (cupin superfamily)
LSSTESGTGRSKARVIANGATPEYFFAEGCFITELSNSCADHDVSIARARLEPGKTTRWHCLRGTTERYVVQQGEGLVEVADLPAQRVSPGDVVIIPPQARQRICNTGATDLVFLAICSPRFSEAVYVDVED